MADIAAPFAPFDRLAECQVKRRMYIRATNRLGNTIRAQVRRGMGWSLELPEAARRKINKRAERFVSHVMADGTAPEGEDERLFDVLASDIEIVRQAMAPLIIARSRYESEMRKMARGLPMWSAFASDIKGFGELGLAVVVAECGDLANYAGPAKVWKRLGLAPYAGHSAKAWRIEKWRPRALTADEWIALGYAPQRRAEIHGVISDPLLRAQTVAMKRNGGGHSSDDAHYADAAPYRAVYDTRRARTAETHPDWTKAHSHNDALRIMTKALMRDLWCAWNTREVRTGERIAA